MGEHKKKLGLKGYKNPYYVYARGNNRSSVFRPRGWVEDFIFAFEILRMNLDAALERELVGLPGGPPKGPVL